MKQKVYIETSVISYLINKPNRDIIIAAKQELTRQWWSDDSINFQLFISDFVINEIKEGDEAYAQERMKLIDNLDVLETTNSTLSLAKNIKESKILPEKAANDIFHIAIATVQNIDFLLTWNCKHIANPFILKSIRKIIENSNLVMPTICTPLEILGAENE